MTATSPIHSARRVRSLQSYSAAVIHFLIGDGGEGERHTASRMSVDLEPRTVDPEPRRNRIAPQANQSPCLVVPSTNSTFDRKANDCGRDDACERRRLTEGELWSLLRQSAPI